MPEPELVRRANLIMPNENAAVVLEGLAVDVAGRACLRLDRNDAIVPVAGRDSWDIALRGRPVRARGRLERHAEGNDPVTGVASLQLAGAQVEPIALPADGRIRTATERDAADGQRVEIEGLAYFWYRMPTVGLYGGLVWAPGVPYDAWRDGLVERIVVVRGVLRRMPPAPEPELVDPWEIAAESYALA